jgi:alcohol dehydrogenase
MSHIAPGFDHDQRTRVVYGPNIIDDLGEMVAEWSAQRVLLVTDPHIVEAGHAQRAQDALESVGLEVVVFDAVRENPTTVDVDAALEVAKVNSIDTIVGLGGGSSLDTAKGCNFLLTNGGRMADYWGRDKASEPMLPLVAIPTTAGTGSECQSFALIADADTHMKMACGDPKAAPRIALLDPTLTITQPRVVTANTGIDTLTHALESAVTKPRNEISGLFARRAFALTMAHLPIALDQPDNLESRGQMQLAAAHAGSAIENSMLGAAHSAANPLTAHHDVIHGQAVGLMISTVIRHNAQEPDIAQIYADLAIAARLASPDQSPTEAVEALLAAIQKLLSDADMPRSLGDLNIDGTTIDVMAAEAAKQWTAQFNPRPVDESDFKAFYSSAIGVVTD